MPGSLPSAKRGRAAVWLASALALVAACSAPALDPDIARGERADRDGRVEEALSAYQAALTRCTDPRMSAPRRAACSSACLARAELLERSGRRSEAALAYRSAPESCPWDPTTAAAGLYRAGRLYLELGQDELGYRLLWRTVTEHPDELFAGDALAAVVRDGRRRDVDGLRRALEELFGVLSHTGVADNLLYALADLAEHELADAPAALAQYDKLALDHPASPMRDDALWHGARVARRLGDARGAVSRLERLLATREVTLGPGSYFSVWLDNAQLELGRVWRDDLGEHQAALAAFERLSKHYPASILRDDASWEIALTYDRMGRSADTCRALERLAAAWPDSRYQLEQAPALAAAHRCGERPRTSR